MTIGERIWTDAVDETGIWMQAIEPGDASWREFALIVIRAINQSHGIKEEDEE